MKGLRSFIFWTGFIVGIENLSVLLFLINSGKANIVAFIAVPVLIYTLMVPSIPTITVYYTKSLSQDQKMHAIVCVIVGSIVGLVTLASAFYLDMFAFENVTRPGPFGFGSETDTMVSVNSTSVPKLVVLMSVIPVAMVLSASLHYWIAGARKREVAARLKAQEEESRRRAEEERKRLEQERNYVQNLIGETQSVLREAERKATKRHNSSWLRSVEFVLSKLDDLSTAFDQGDISIEGAKKRIWDLKEKAEVLREPLPEDETTESHTEGDGPKESCYAVLGISQNASHDEIEKARIRKLYLYHPDRYRTAPDYAQQEAKRMEEKINQAANEAHGRLDRRSG